MNKNLRPRWLILLAVFGIGLVGVIWWSKPAEAAPPHLGYGANVAAWDTNLLSSMGFNWIKVFNAPGSDLPQNALIRLDAHHTHLGDVTGFGDSVQALAQNNGAYIDAYEIGNEVNLDASYGWGASPIAADYKTLLCEAYNRIKLADPTAIVVSAGLAPTGRVQGNWNGHAGHNGLYQDEREFLREFLDAGGGACFDALGYHPYGYSADFDATPDVGSSDPTQNCVNGFCFRGVEKIYEIMDTEYSLGHKTVWATEFGWIVEPPSHCLSDPSWSGRIWQIVTLEKQASNLRGAYEYAEAHYPWMGGLFIFNLNFNEGPYPECEQMRFYAIKGRPAQTALTAMPKNPATVDPQLYAPVNALSFMIAAAEQPITLPFVIPVGHGGMHSSFNYTATVDSAAAVVPTLNDATGSLWPGQEASVTGTIDNQARPQGLHTGTITINATPGTGNTPFNIPVQVRVVEQIHRAYLPVLVKGN
jgi:hypothetical protein